MAEHCSYQTDQLKEMLRDRLVCRVNHTGIQRKLLAEKDLTYDKALTLALAIEASEKDSKNLRGAGQQGSVNYQSRGTGGANEGHQQEPPKLTCYRCGGPHLAPKCKFKEAECRYCKKMGHLARVCRAKAKGKQPSQPIQPAHYVADGADHQDSSYGAKSEIRAVHQSSSTFRSTTRM